MRVRARPVAMGTAIGTRGSAGHWRIRRRNWRQGRGRRPGGAHGPGRAPPVSREPRGLHRDAHTPEFQRLYFDGHNLRHKRGQRGVDRRERLGPRSKHPSPHTVPKTRTAPRIAAQASGGVDRKAEQEAGPRGKAFQSGRSQGPPGVLHIASSANHFVNGHEENQTEEH